VVSARVDVQTNAGNTSLHFAVTGFVAFGTVEKKDGLWPDKGKNAILSPQWNF
jgi:hypothetical protein